MTQVREQLREIMAAEQENRCAVCEQPETKRGARGTLSIDHDHVTGHVRGLLCAKCNMAVGLLQDSAELAERVMLYLSA